MEKVLPQQIDKYIYLIRIGAKAIPSEIGPRGQVAGDAGNPCENSCWCSCVVKVRMFTFSHSLYKAFRKCIAYYFYSMDSCLHQPDS